MPTRSPVRELFGVLRSLVVYWRPGRQAGLRRLYAPFVSPGDLVFDVGAHLGDRTAAFSALGAEVVALEPQPRVVRWLRRLVGHRRGVRIVEEAVGPRPGTARLAVSRLTPTVSTVSPAWREDMVERNAGFRGVRWDHHVEIPMTTLDELIRRFGVPAFCKLDIEGYEADALDGLEHPVQALSFEFVRGGLGVAVRCVHRLESLARYEYNAVAGEGRSFLFPDWVSAEALRAWLDAGADGLPFGDLFARRSGETT